MVLPKMRPVLRKTTAFIYDVQKIEDIVASSIPFKSPFLTPRILFISEKPTYVN